jgi:hypothetical protein
MRTSELLGNAANIIAVLTGVIVIGAATIRLFQYLFHSFLGKKLPHGGPNPVSSDQIRSFFIGTFVLVLLVAVTSLPNWPYGNPNTPVVGLGGTATSTPKPTDAPTMTPLPKPTDTPTMTPLPNPYPPYNGTLVLNDLLINNSNGYGWAVGGNSAGRCSFTGGGYQVTALQQHLVFMCSARNTNFGDFAYQVHMTIMNGAEGGIIFRSNPASLSYVLEIGQDGSYVLNVYSSTRFIRTVNSGSIASFSTGLDQTNVIGVVAIGSSIDLYMNSQHFASLSDETSSQGQIGVIAGYSLSQTDNQTNVIYRDAQVWTM